VPGRAGWGTLAGWLASGTAARRPPVQDAWHPDPGEGSRAHAPQMAGARPADAETGASSGAVVGLLVSR